MCKVSRLFIVLLTLLVSIALTSAMAQEEWPGKSNGITDAYDFPVKPGMPEWSALTSHGEMLAVCQIPEETLKNMATEGLLETILNYPLWVDILAYDNLQAGFDVMVSNFNGLREFLARVDAGKVLLSRYSSSDLTAIGSDWTPEQKGEYAFRLAYVEILLAQESILSNLSKNQLTNLLTEAIDKYQQKLGLPETYGYLSIQSTVLLMGRVLNQIGYAPFNEMVQENEYIQRFLTKGSPIPEADLREITTLAYEFLQNGK